MSGGTAACAATRLLTVCLLLAGFAVGHILSGAVSLAGAAGAAATASPGSVAGHAEPAGAEIDGAAPEGGAGGHHRALWAATRPPVGLGTLLTLLALGLVVTCARPPAPNRSPAGLGTRRRGPPWAGTLLLRDVGVCRR